MGGGGQGEAGGGDAQGASHPFGHQGGEETGDNGGVVHDAHALHLHGKDGGADGGAKEGGEAGSHAGHGDHPLVSVIQMQQLPQLVAHAAANLQRRPLSAGAAAGQVGEDGGDEDEGHLADVELSGISDGGQDELGAAIVVHVQNVIQCQDDQTGQGQAEQDPKVRLPKGGHLGQTEGKGRAHQPHCAAHQHRQSHPLAERPQVTVLPMMKPSQLAGEKHRKPLLNGAKSYGIGSL